MRVFVKKIYFSISLSVFILFSSVSLRNFLDDTVDFLIEVNYF